MPQFNDIIKAINGAISDFNDSIPASQKSILDAVQLELKGLDLDRNGDIKTSVANLKTIGKIKAQLQNTIITDQYLNKVQDFVNSFATVAELQNQYWNAIESNFKPPALLAEIQKQAVTDTVTSLTEHGVAANISDALNGILQTSVTSGGSYADLTDQLRTALTDQEGKPGLLSQYAKTITTDALNTFARQYTQTISESLGYEWYAYQGSDIETTRPFCFAMTEFTYFNVSEIPRLLAAENLYYTNPKTGLRELVPIYVKTGLPAGLKAQTNPSNFLDLCGGWNCGHQARPVTAGQVPTYIINRAQIPDIMTKAQAAAPELDQLGQKYAKENGGIVTPINLKGYESITRKSRDELSGDYTQIKDAVRNTVVVPYEKLDTIATEIQKQVDAGIGPFTRVKVQEGSKFFGYKGVITNVKLENGTIGEMQFNSPGMIYAKGSKESALNVMSEAEYNRIADITGLPGGMGHTYYEEIRKITDKTATPADLIRKADLIAKSEEYYSHFYDITEAPPEAVTTSLMTLKEATKAMDNYDPPKDQRGAVLTYTDTGYTGINRYLRNGTNPTDDKLKNIQLIKTFLENAPKGAGTSYRGIAFGTEEKTYNNFFDAVKSGKGIRFKSFLSTSADPDEASTFRHSSVYSVKMTIEGKSGVPIGKFSNIESEEEVLFNTDTEFQVVDYDEKISTDSGQHLLYLTVKEI